MQAEILCQFDGDRQGDHPARTSRRVGRKTGCRKLEAALTFAANRGRMTLVFYRKRARENECV